MKTPTAQARAALDHHIQCLARYGDGLTLDDFRTQNIRQSLATARSVRKTLYVSGTIFMIAVIGDLIAKNALVDSPLIWIGVWAIALGGLGAIASIFLLVLKLIPQETLKNTDQVEVVGRIFLGCLFSLVLCITIIPSDLMVFFNSFDVSSCKGDTSKCAVGGAKLLLPFLCGYSIPLVLGLLGKVIRAVELTIGLDDRRETPAAKGVRRR